MADVEKPLEQVSSEDLFKAATAEEAVPPLPVEAPPEPAPVVEPPAPAVVEPPGPGVPSWRLREEAEARRLAEDRARALEMRLNQIATHLQQQQKPPDFFENPNQATHALIMSALQPFAEEQRRFAEDQRRREMYTGKVLAGVIHGQDKVDAAEQAFLKARENEVLDPADYERVVQSPNRYDAVVQWHKRQSVLASVGDDPNAWFEKQLETRMSDPKFQATLMEKVRASAASRPPMTKMPPSLSRTTAAAGNSGDVEGDLSDASLFAYAMKR